MVLSGKARSSTDGCIGSKVRHWAGFENVGRVEWCCWWDQRTISEVSVEEETYRYGIEVKDVQPCKIIRGGEPLTVGAYGYSVDAHDDGYDVCVAAGIPISVVNTTNSNLLA